MATKKTTASRPASKPRKAASTPRKTATTKATTAKTKATTRKATAKATPRASAKAAPKEPASAARRGAKGSPALSHEAVLRQLDASHEEPPTIPASVIAQEARELQGVLRKLGPRMLAGSRLDAALLTSLPVRVVALDEADARWAEHRFYALPTARKKLRTQAEDLRSDAIAALRHFVPKDDALQARVDKIVEGAGIADLIDDLKKLSPLVAANTSALARAQLPANAHERLLSLAQSLEEATSDEVSERTGSDEARDAQLLRNRAYWWLREALDEIRECGRHAFRKEPALARHFRSSYGVKVHSSKKTPTTPPT